jgi:hypothetical protein
MESEAKLRKLLSQPLNQLTPAQGIAAMLAFYASQRADGVLIDEDGDMLLFQWGVISAVELEEFYLNITRQFILPDEDEPYQLSLHFAFPAGASPPGLKAGNRWCRTPQEIDKFGKFIESSPAYVAVGSARPDRVDLNFCQS